MVAPVEFRLEIKAYSPETIPMERLARYLSNFAKVLGETHSVHFVKLEPGSTTALAHVDWEAAPKVRRRVTDLRGNEGPKEAIEAKRAIERDLALDNAEYGNVIDQLGARILHFPGAKRAVEPEYGPLSQPGTVDGIPIMVGGQNDPVPVHLDDRGVTHLCYASREVAKCVGLHLFTTPVRATGVGSWFRSADGTWTMRRFMIQTFVELRHESLSDVTTRLQAIDANWKKLKDPLANLIALKDSEA
ncbi:MAG: hypothetical protein FJW23_16185 [Acidimicrobiia bacterium]|nr:hypothetical protein [Acidimicrobiia bacterium]